MANVKSGFLIHPLFMCLLNHLCYIDRTYLTEKARMDFADMDSEDFVYMGIDEVSPPHDETDDESSVNAIVSSLQDPKQTELIKRMLPNVIASKYDMGYRHGYIDGRKELIDQIAEAIADAARDYGKEWEERQDAKREAAAVRQRRFREKCCGET